MNLTATQQAWVLSNVENRILTVEFPAFENLSAQYISNEGWMPTIGPLYSARVLKPWTMTRSVGGRLTGGGRTVIGLGNIEVANADGKLGWMVQDWHKRPVVIRWGDPDWLDIDDHIVIHNGFVDSLESSGLEIIIKLSDDREALNVLWPRDRYSANTTLDSNGVVEGLGEIKPMVHGNVINADTVLLQNAALYYGVVGDELENQFTWSQDLTHADWTPSQGTVAADQVESPDGTLADSLTATNNTCLLSQNGSNTTVEKTIWALVRASTGTVDVNFGIGSATSTAITIGTDWEVISFTSSSSGITRNIQILNQIGSIIYIARMQWANIGTVGTYARTAAYPRILPDIVKVRDNGVELVEGATNDWTEPFPGIVQIDNVVGRITADTEAGTGLAEDVFVRLLGDGGITKFDASSTEVMPDVDVSIWSNEERPLFEYLDAVANSVGCVWYPDRDGTLVVALLDIPQTPAFEFDERDIQGQIQSDLVTLPIDSISIGVKQSWAGQDADSLASSLSASDRKLLSQPEVFIVASDDATLEAAEESPDEFDSISTLLRVQSEARTTGRTWLPMLSVKRELHKSLLLRGAGLIELASTIRLAHNDVDAFAGLQDEGGEFIVDENFLRIERGKDMVVLSLEETFPFGSVQVEGWA